VREAFDFPAGHVVISYLPLSHSAEQMVSIYIPMTLGLTTQFAESLEKLPENLREIRPHVLFAVPRVWEKIQAAMQDAGAENPPLKRKILTGLLCASASPRLRVRWLLRPRAAYMRPLRSRWGEVSGHPRPHGCQYRVRL
jgi:long-subunit acyl-CoA synthetase (AMP-forming)